MFFFFFFFFWGGGPQKSHKLLTETLESRKGRLQHLIAIHSIPGAGYVTNVLALSVRNSVTGRRAVSVISENFTSCDFTSCILLLFYSSKRVFIKWCFIVRSTIGTLCPIMSHYNDLDFSECGSI